MEQGARDQIQAGMREFGLDPEAVARAVCFAIEQPADVEIGSLTIRPTVQNWWELFADPAQRLGERGLDEPVGEKAARAEADHRGRQRR